MSDRFDTLGARIAQVQDRLREADGVAMRARVRRRLLEQEVAPVRRWIWFAGFGALAAAALALLFIVPAIGRPLTFEYVASGEPGTVGAWVAAPAERTELLRFSDGSEIELRPHAQARVAELDRAEARVVLERGSADVRIQPGGDRRWRIDAGPYRVTVTGTQFSVAWDPQREAFELDLREGAVIVEGPELSSAQRVHAGQLLRIAAPTEVAVSGEAAPAGADAGEAPDPIAEPAVADAGPAIAVAPTEDDASGKPARDRTRRDNRGAAAPLAPSTTEAPSWRELADRGDYRDALAAAEARGFDTLCASLPADQLLRLADVARFARKPKRAIEALDAVRSRFADDDAAATAAFERGRIALGSGSHASAVTWLETYLRERPSGALAREATGRLIEALDAAGRREAAREAARRYVAKYPDGPHADLAARVLSGGG